MSKYLKRSKELTIKARKEVFSEYVGNHISKRKGEGYDFAELREYSLGDDVRHIDWTITAKVGKPYIKLFHEEHRLFVNVVSFLGGSTYFGTKRLKQDLIAEIGAILFFSALKKGDIYSSSIFTDRENYKSRITNNIGSVSREVEEILSFDPIGKAVDIEKFARNFLKTVKRKSILFLIGDFLDLASKNKIPNLTAIAKKHEVVVVIVRDKLEENLGEFVNSSFIDPSSKKIFSATLTKGVKSQYQSRVKDYDKRLIDYFNKNQIQNIKIYTDEDPFKKLLSFRLFH